MSNDKKTIISPNRVIRQIRSVTQYLYSIYAITVTTISRDVSFYLIFRLRESSVTQAEKTALVVKAVILYFQTDIDTGQFQYWDHAANTASSLHKRFIS